MLFPSFLINIPFYGKSDDAIGLLGIILMTLQAIVMVVSIVPVENALKENFTDEGLRKGNER